VLASTNLIDVGQLVPIAVFGLFAAAAWWLLDHFAANKSRAAERLEELKNPRQRRGAEAEALLKKPDTVAKVLETTTAFARPLQPKSAVEMGKLKARLSAAGFRSEGAIAVFLGLKFAGLLVGLFVGGGAVVGLRGLNMTSLLWTAVCVATFFYLPDVVVGMIGRGRTNAIFLALPDALDMMVVCVEAGLGLDQAMRKVSDEMKRSYPVLSEELALTNFQLQMGRTRSDALHELGVRSGVVDLRTLAGILIQADKFGSSIAQALRVQSDSMRIRRQQLAEEKAAKTAVKLIFPLVLFIFPGIFVILVGPAAIAMIREMFPKMTGAG
jgi:tight adherence protein C